MKQHAQHLLITILLASTAGLLCFTLLALLLGAGRLDDRPEQSTDTHVTDRWNRNLTATYRKYGLPWTEVWATTQSQLVDTFGLANPTLQPILERTVTPATEELPNEH